jgi:light-regulated signal transduction histidine kinase (bacteriophytochrome)
LDTTQSTYNKIKSNEAEYCGKVPLHQTNQIQPHGVLLVLEKKTLNVLQASENTEQLFGIKVTSMVNAPLVSFVSSRHIQTLQERLEQSIEARLPLLVTINKIDFLMMVNAFETYLIAEFEKVETKSEQNSFVDIYHEVKYAMAEIDKMTTTHEACQVIAKELKRISGFDKVMIYQFDTDWNGEVVAEAMDEDIESYLGLKFPASDIPPQARELYKKTPYRLIPNIDYVPVKLYPVINPLTGAFIDLTNSSLRSVAAIHLEYLKNMEVSASMSTRILKDGLLWGLISCHHRTPKYVSYQVRSLFEMLSSLITSKITAVQNADIFEYKSRTHARLNKVMERIYRKSDLVEDSLSNLRKCVLYCNQTE